MSRRFRTVLIGFGAVAEGLSRDRRMARYFRRATHAQILSDHPRFDWIATVDPSGQAQTRARRWGGVVAGDADEVVALCPEVAVLAGPPESRLESLRSLPSLRAVLVEKPLGPDLASTRRFIAFCTRRGIRMQVCLWRRGDITFRRLAAARMKRLGTVQAVFGLYGNGLRNNGVHLIDFLRMQAGEIDAVQALDAARSMVRSPLAGDVALPLTVRLRGGAQATIHPVDFSTYREVSLDIWGMLARRTFYQESLVVRDYPRRANRALDGEREIATDAPRTVASTVSSALWNLYGNLADALERKAALWSDGANALVAETVVDAALRSAARGGRTIGLR